MGKVKRQRQKFHESPNTKAPEIKTEENDSSAQSDQPLLPVPENVFASMDIDFSSLRKDLSDDTKSVVSIKSLKSELGTKYIPKKDKVKLRRDMLLQKIDSLQQQKKKNKIRKKRKNNVIMGNTNSLHDSLPSLDSLLKLRDFKIKVRETSKKNKGIAKASKRKKTLVDNVNLYKKLLTDKTFKKNPIEAVKQLVANRVKCEL